MSSRAKKTYDQSQPTRGGPPIVSSPLVAEFLLPVWLESLEENDKDRVTEKLAQLIDSEDGTMSFRFSVKATLLIGEKA